MVVIVSGSTGLVGSALIEALTLAGYEPVRLVRRKEQVAERQEIWSPSENMLRPQSLEGAEAVVHLSGESVGEGRWTRAKKERIRDSRVDSTALLCSALASLERPPQKLICASAVGYYGDRGAEELTEDSPPGHGFLAEVCQDWESATTIASSSGIRVVNLRLGVILAPHGGVLAKMLTPFRLGLGGAIGPGSQYLSWVSLTDVTRAILHTIDTPALSGPVNLASPGAVTNRQFTEALCSTLHRPALLPMPSFAARLAFGEMADALLLASARMVPRKLVESGFSFRNIDLHEALSDMLHGESSALQAHDWQEIRLRGHWIRGA